MNPRTKKKMDSINRRLEDFHQHARLIDITPSTVTLNTGQILIGNDASRFIKRVMNSKITEWVKNTDALLAGNMSADEIKHISFAVGGKACQQKHGERIKSNLNTGVSWNKGTKGQNIGTRGPQPQSVKDAISKKNSGAGNGMYGVKMSEEDKQAKSSTMKRKILLGEFTPKSNNRNTHWDAVLDGVLYRSSWEALYKYVNPEASYEELRVEYNYKGESKIYIVDFIDHVNRVVVEVKPKELCVGDKFNVKLQAIRKWAEQNLYEVLLVDQYWLIQQKLHIDYSRFDEKTATKIRKLYEIS